MSVRETKEFRTLAVATAATCIGLAEGVKFSHIHEIAEFVLGHPVWSHEFGHRPTMQKLSAAIYAQLPGLPSKADAEADHERAASTALHNYGEMVELARGNGTRDTSPLATLDSMLAAQPGAAE